MFARETKLDLSIKPCLSIINYPWSRFADLSICITRILDVLVCCDQLAGLFTGVGIGRGSSWKCCLMFSCNGPKKSSTYPTRTMVVCGVDCRFSLGLMGSIDGLFCAVGVFFGFDSHLLLKTDRSANRWNPPTHPLTTRKAENRS